MKFEIAPREKLRFLIQIEAIVLRILRHPEALVSDESRLSDFGFWSSDWAARPGKKPHYFVFQTRHRRPGKPEFMIEREMRAVPFKLMTIRKIYKHTGVDITPVFDEY